MLRIAKVSLLLCLALTALLGCGRRDNVAEDQGPELLYGRGFDAMNASNFAGAIQYFQALEARYPFSPETRQAQLDLIYLYYRSQQPEQAIDAAEEFQRENPTHERLDYALYMRGLVLFDQAPNIIEKLLRVDLSLRPPKDTLRSFSTFQELIRRFPESEYVPDARQRMVFLRNRLADFENHVADYYLRRGAYVAAINRAKYALEHYPEAPQLEKTLQVLVTAYEQLGMRDLAADARRVLRDSFGEESATAQLER
ncbi:MAG TPA: outer membrane protein assembly factor BamD [Gammaproteobacteria bacterium]|nr:outer membrane protein assembly factor BamD [Gammaproteobacteria bacterium]